VSTGKFLFRCSHNIRQYMSYEMTGRWASLVLVAMEVAREAARHVQPQSRQE
jgi:hypothetical protein